MLQLSFPDGVAFDPFSFQQDGLATAEVNVGRRQVLQALVIAAVIVVLDEAPDVGFETPGRDTVQLSQDETPLAPATFRRGLRELLEKEFLFRSPYDGTFFVNIRFMFNGDRLAFVKGYKLRNAPAEQGTLALTAGEAPEARET